MRINKFFLCLGDLDCWRERIWSPCRSVLCGHSHKTNYERTMWTLSWTLSRNSLIMKCHKLCGHNGHCHFGFNIFFDYLWFGLKKLIVWGITYNIYELKDRNLPSFFIKNDFKKPNFFYDVKQPSTSLIMIIILKGLIG
jgi:hypothetical protein